MGYYRGRRDYVAGGGDRQIYQLIDRINRYAKRHDLSDLYITGSWPNMLAYDYLAGPAKQARNKRFWFNKLKQLEAAERKLFHMGRIAMYQAAYPKPN